MWKLSITPMDEAFLEEICDDLIMQQKRGISDCAMLMHYYTPEGTPPMEKAKSQCRVYDRFRERLDAAGARHGVLVQSTLGHIYPPTEKHPFQQVVSLVAGTEHDVYKPYDKTQLEGTTFTPTVCPYDKGFHNYIREQMRELAGHKPSVIMIDDDVGLVYRTGIKGCACPLHMAEFNRRAGTNMTREDLIGRIFSGKPEDERYRQIYLDTQRDGIVSAVKAMREGIDSVDPAIQGAISIAANYCEFTEDIAEAFAGEGNPRIARFNNGAYGAAGARFFTKNAARAAMQRETLRGKMDVFLAETDTCPHNRYATGAALLHAQMTSSILEGAKGAKHWITQAGVDLSAGKAYRAILAKHAGFYDALMKLSDSLAPVGCRIPLSAKRDYELDVPGFNAKLISPWATCVLERFGFPLYFASEGEGAVFLDEDKICGFSDAELSAMLSGTVFLSSKGAKQLIDRGLGGLLGIEVREWTGKLYNQERIRITGTTVRRQMESRELVPLSEDVEVLSMALSTANGIGEEVLFPAVTLYQNALGGTAVVFCGTPDTGFGYNQSAAFLNGARKKQIGDILRRTGNLPVYYAGDSEVYLRGGKLPDGRLMCVFFNIGLDQLFEIPIVTEKPVEKLEMLTPEGESVPCPFRVEEGSLIAETPAYTLMPVVLFLS